MNRPNPRSAWLAAAATGILLAGLLQLLLLRFESGDIYPAYSSLRADPLGTRVLYESLERMPGRPVARALRPLEEQPAESGGTCLLLGLKPRQLAWLTEAERDWLQRYLALGGRVVLALSPARDFYDPFLELEDPEASGSGDDAPPGDSGGPEAPEEGSEEPPLEPEAPDGDPAFARPRRVRFADTWDLQVTPYDASVRDDEDAAPVAEPEPGVPGRAVSWHAPFYLAPGAFEWNILYTCRGVPAIVERPVGRGSLVLVADAYLFSNEALLRERHSALILHLLGDGGPVVFQEAHLGVRAAKGLMLLARKYRLHGLLAGLLLLAALFVWRETAPWLPVRADDAETDLRRVGGRDAHAGFVNLLRRNLPPKRLMRTCVEEWARSAGRSRPEKAERLRAAWSRLEAEGANPVDAYRRLAETLNEGTRHARKH